MGFRKWSEIKSLSKATDADRAAARSELADELRSALTTASPRRVDVEIPWRGALASASQRGHVVGELLPPGFERYLRLFHPFVPWSADSSVPIPASECVRWAELARRAGVSFGPNLTWRQLETVLMINADGDRDFAVWEGELELDTATTLFESLAKDDDGGYFLAFGLAAIIGTSAHSSVTYFARSLDDRSAAAQDLDTEVPGSITTAEYVWPSDRSWIVCTDYDLTSTYVALDNAGAERLHTQPRLEVVDVTLETRVDDAADERLERESA